MKIAVVDDSREDAQNLVTYLKQFQSDKKVLLEIHIFYASFDFLEEYHGEYDVIFLDIEMPGSNGMEVAKEIRTKDQAVGIIFVTSMAQYAIEGYEVNAIDFMVKPVGYFNFASKLEKAFRFYENRVQQEILISSKDGVYKLSLSEIYYIEKERDFLVFLTQKDRIRERGSIKDLKHKLLELPFSECTSGCLVNLSYVKRIGKDFISLSTGVELPLSRRLKKQFSEAYIHYMGGL